MFDHNTAPVRTKFICGIGPASSNAASMEALMKAGANVFRNNFAHAQYDEYQERLSILRHLNEKLGTNVKMMADLQGQNLRIGMLPPTGEVQLHEGIPYTFVTNGGELTEGDFPINDDNLHNDVKTGESITFADGALEGTITKVDGHRITVILSNGGIIKQRKSVNVPETELTASNLTEKDYRDLDFLLGAGVDILGVSFVAGREELDIVRRIAKERNLKPAIVAKVERKKAIENLWEIIQGSDGIMIARGDLGIELPMEEIPLLQKEIVQLCHSLKKPAIVATQMMLSMVNNNRPTRAEVSDVANAVFDGADALMLSEETMVGIHPAHVVATMSKIAHRTENYIHNRENYFTKFGL